MESTGEPFLDVPTLLESSQPRGGSAWVGYGVGIFVLIVLLSAYLSASSPRAARAIHVIAPLAMLGVVGGMLLWTSLTVQRRRAEMKQLEAVEELMQLRRWPQAAMALEGMLVRPTRTPQARAQALIFLATVLARYHRFTDAIAVQDHLLEHVRFDEGTDYGLRLARAMAMLREDHLVDADRAIGELKRLTQNKPSAGLALIELYRDVKTGHPEEAVAVFDEAADVLRDQLGHRFGDACALVARAYDLLGRQAEAAVMYEKATLLQPLAELERRYPEVAALRDRYGAVEAPR